MLDLIYTIAISIATIYFAHRIYIMMTTYFSDRATSYVTFVESKKQRPPDREEPVQIVNEEQMTQGASMFDELVDFVGESENIQLQTTSLENLPITNNIDMS